MKIVDFRYLFVFIIPFQSTPLLISLFFIIPSVLLSIAPAQTVFLILKTLYAPKGYREYILWAPICTPEKILRAYTWTLLLLMAYTLCGIHLRFLLYFRPVRLMLQSVCLYQNKIFFRITIPSESLWFWILLWRQKISVKILLQWVIKNI